MHTLNNKPSNMNLLSSLEFSKSTLRSSFKTVLLRLDEKPSPFTNDSRSHISLTFCCSAPSDKSTSPDHIPFVDSNKPFTTSTPSPLIHQKASGLVSFIETSHLYIFQVLWIYHHQQCHISSPFRHWSISELRYRDWLLFVIYRGYIV